MIFEFQILIKYLMIAKNQLLKAINEYHSDINFFETISVEVTIWRFEIARYVRNINVFSMHYILCENLNVYVLNYHL